MSWSKKYNIPEKGKQILRYITDRRIPLYASGACFFIALSLFPVLVLLLSMVRYTGFSVDSVTELLEIVIPQALMPTAKQVIHSIYRNTSGTVMSISALTALWSAGSGIHGVARGLNGIYGIEEGRGYLRARSMSTLYVVGFLLVLLLTLVLHVFGKTAQRWLMALNTPVFELLAEILNLRFFLLLLLQTGTFALMYMFLPARRNRFSESLPGALLAAIGWQAFSQGFSLYVENFNNYANIYGSVYGIVLCMLWLYLCVCLLFYGAALNRWLKKV